MGLVVQQPNVVKSGHEPKGGLVVGKEVQLACLAVDLGEDSLGKDLGLFGCGGGGGIRVIV